MSFWFRFLFCCCLSVSVQAQNHYTVRIPYAGYASANVGYWDGKGNLKDSIFKWQSSYEHGRIVLLGKDKNSVWYLECLDSAEHDAGAGSWRGIKQLYTDGKSQSFEIPIPYYYHEYDSLVNYTDLNKIFETLESLTPVFADFPKDLDSIKKNEKYHDWSIQLNDKTLDKCIRWEFVVMNKADVNYFDWWISFTDYNLFLSDTSYSISGKRVEGRKLWPKSDCKVTVNGDEDYSEHLYFGSDSLVYLFLRLDKDCKLVKQSRYAVSYLDIKYGKIKIHESKNRNSIQEPTECTLDIPILLNPGASVFPLIISYSKEFLLQAKEMLIQECKQAREENKQARKLEAEVKKMESK